MYTDQGNKSYYSSSSNESDDTTIIDLTRRFKISPENEANNATQSHEDEDDENLTKKTQNQYIDQLII